MSRSSHSSGPSPDVSNLGSKCCEGNRPDGSVGANMEKGI
jgi:hypothetical protein